MISLFCYKDDRLVMVHQKGNFQVDAHSIICIDEKMYKIDDSYFICDKESLTIDDMRFQCMDIKDHFGMIDLSKTCVLGRNRLCNVVFDDEHVSSFHARIENGWIYDQKSTNGTYVNGKRITSYQLQNLDWICIAGYSLLVLGSYCICQNQKLNKNFPLKTLIKKDNESFLNVPSTFEDNTQKLSIQLYTPLDPIQKGSLFSAIGSSLLILVSSIVSALVSFLFMKDTSSLVSMGLTSGSMSLGFLGYGLIMRKIQYKEQVSTNEEKKHAYLAYLEEMELKIKKMFSSIQAKEEKREIFIQDRTSQTYHYFKQSDRLCALPKCKNAWLELQLPLINYIQKQDVMYNELESFLKKQPIMIEQRKWLTFTSIFSCDLPFSIIKEMFCQWAWQAGQEDVEWIFITKEIIYDRMFELPYCSLNSKRKRSKVVWVAKKKEMISMQKQDLFIGLNKIDQPKLSLDFTVRKLFLKLYEKQAQEPNVSQALKQMTAFVDLSVCVGYDQQKMIWLDLHESKDGPHGLIAGTTGSGKSEWLISILMQLAYNNTSQSLEYVLIDFKGGAFGTMLSRFAHCAGMLTNLSMMQIERLEKGLQAELDKRQYILQNFISLHPDQKAHIDSYNEFFKQAKMSHLLIVVDEFAQLKLKAPDFMQHLKEIARIGRSLGIHLILSTQKPMGVVDEQIWSNSRFKVCFKVNDAMDSQEVIHSDLAAKLTCPGQFILHTDNQQHLQEGQGFYMHAPIKDIERVKIFDKRQEVEFQTQKKSITLYQKIAETILSRDMPKRKILLPPLDEITSISSLFVIDRPDKQAYINIDVFNYASIGILIMDEKLLKEWFLALLAHYQDHVIYRKGYCRWASLFEEYKQLEGEKIILLDFSNENTLVKNGCCIRVYDSVDPSVSYIASHEVLFAFGIQDIDLCRTFFSSYKLPQAVFEGHMGLVKIKDRIDPCVFSNKYIKIDQTKPQINVDGIYLGGDIDSGRSCYWNHIQPLVIVYAQKSMETWIKKRFKKESISWHNFDGQAKIYALSAIQDMDILSSRDFAQWQYDIDLMWIGLGYEDYGYCLHRKVSLEKKSNAILWQKENVYRLEW